MTVAVIQFPGSNCEAETLDALTSLGIPNELISWTNDGDIGHYSGFILPGGFSFQDRIRAGVIAAKLPIIKRLKHASATQQIPIMGICNGAQILVESGLFSTDDSMTDIIDLNYVNDHAIGFMCDWGFLTPFNAQQNVFLRQLNDTDVFPIQICHAEGRFLSKNPPISGLRYCRFDGKTDDSFPITPNGAPLGTAAISNAAGNVLAIMPHPERSIIPERVPLSIRHVIQSYGLKLANIQTLFKAFSS